MKIAQLTFDGTEESVVRPAEVLNPASQTSKAMEMTARRAINLDRLCALWLVAKGSPEAARAEKPYKLPASHPQAKELTKALNASSLYDRPSSSKHAAYAVGEIIPWEWVFDHWESGALRRGIDALLSYLPEESRRKAEEQM